MTFILQDSLFLNRKPYREDVNFPDRIHLAKDLFFEEFITGIPLKVNRAEDSHLIRRNDCKVGAYEKYNEELTYKDHIITKDTKKFLRDLKSQSRRVVVVAFPRAWNKHEILQNEWRKKLRGELEREGITMITLGTSMPEAYYCDGSHPNEKGRAVRSAQMVELITRIQASTP